ncbi:MAG TPA: M1 family peptidase, partial [Lacibacter sp.]|nr:M1 family peptidase [Lacibacter sp.]
MKFRRIIVLFLFSAGTLLQLSATAQLMKNRDQFTRQDTLRGTLSRERSWWDVVMYDLHVQPDFSNFTLSGSNTILFKIVQNPASVLQIDLQDPLQLDSAYLNNVPVTFHREGNVWWIQLPRNKMPPSLPQHQYPGKGPLQELRLYYHGVPRPALTPPGDGGVVWRKDKQGNPWIGTACQGLGASMWWPCKDHQSDEPDSTRIRITVPDTLSNISNGRLESVSPTANGLRTWTWFVSQPINSYNITMNVGKYAHFRDTLMGENGQLDLDYYVMEYNLDKAKRQFEQVKPMLRAFEHWMGPYPFYTDGYKLVETSYLGM